MASRRSAAGGAAAHAALPKAWEEGDLLLVRTDQVDDDAPFWLAFASETFSGPRRDGVRVRVWWWQVAAGRTATYHQGTSYELGANDRVEVLTVLRVLRPAARAMQTTKSRGAKKRPGGLTLTAAEWRAAVAAVAEARQLAAAAAVAETPAKAARQPSGKAERGTPKAAKKAERGSAARVQPRG